MDQNKLQAICDDYNKNREDNFAFIAPTNRESHTSFIHTWRNKYRTDIKFLITGEVLRNHFDEETDLALYEISIDVAKKIKKMGIALTLNNKLPESL